MEDFSVKMWILNLNMEKVMDNKDNNIYLTSNTNG